MSSIYNTKSNCSGNCMVLCRASSLQPWVEKYSSLPILSYNVYYATCTLPWILIWSMEIKITCDLTMGEDTQTLFLCFKNSIVIISLLYLQCLRNPCIRAMHSETHKMQLECLPWVCIYTLLFEFTLQNVNQKAVHSFRHVRSYCNSDYALAGLIREIRNDYLCKSWLWMFWVGTGCVDCHYLLVST